MVKDLGEDQSETPVTMAEASRKNHSFLFRIFWIIFDDLFPSKRHCSVNSCQPSRQKPATLLCHVTEPI